MKMNNNSIKSEILEVLNEFEPHYVSSNGKKYYTIDDLIIDGIEIKDIKKVSEGEILKRIFGRIPTEADPLTSEEFQPFVELMKKAWSLSNTSRSYVFRKLGMQVKWISKKEAAAEK